MNFRTRFMPYDVYERHSVSARLLKQAVGNQKKDFQVLDVGGRIKLLERFLPYQVTSVNVDGTGNLFGSGIALPFANDAFDAVVNIDTLEHLPGNKRLDLLSECFRVADRFLVIAAPFGSQEHIENEKKLNDLYLSVTGESHTYLNEHVHYGLPDISDIAHFSDMLKSATVQQYFAGDYLWQGKSFERAILAQQKSGFLSRFVNLYNQISSMALFHSVKLTPQPNLVSNRFYLFIKKEA